MSVTVKHLNADSTFLLVFSPEVHPRPADLKSANGAFTVLIDPFLSGSSIVLAPWFAITRHNVPSAVQHLSQIEEPDVVVVSQNKPDHCHKETLLQLRPEGKSIIAAEPGAAKTIRSWNHFDPNRIQGLSKYDSRSKFSNSLRLSIPPRSVHGYPGELCISFVAAKNYMTGLHNAFGITYQPPTYHKATASIPTIEIPRIQKYFHLPPSPISPVTPVMPSTPRKSSLHMKSKSLDLEAERRRYERPRTSERGHRPRLSRASGTKSSEILPFSELKQIQKHFDHSSPVRDERTGATSPSWAHFDFALNQAGPDQATTASDLSRPRALPTPPDSPAMSSTPSTDSTINVNKAHSPDLSDKASWRSTTTAVPQMRSPPSTMFVPPVVLPGRPKALSVIYSPHGIPLADLQAYIQNHLVKLPGALPLTLLLHSFDHAQNPWYLGGNVMHGAAGGIKIAQSLMARCWLSAHDEPKDDRGVAVKKLKVHRMQPEEVQRQLWAGEEAQGLRRLGWFCDVRSLGVGKEMILRSNERDLCVGMDKSEKDSQRARVQQIGNWI